VDGLVAVGRGRGTVFSTLLEDLVRGEARPHYKGSSRPSLQGTPPPDLSLIDTDDYAAMALQISRGCPFRCEFCDITKIYGREPRLKSLDQVLQELDQLYTGGWRGSLFIVDDNFIGNRKEIGDMLPHIARWQQERGYPFKLFTEASVDLARETELLDGMVKAGFTEVFLGIETPIEASLTETKKTQNVRLKVKGSGEQLSLAEAIQRIQRKGIEVMGGFIMGFDNDPPDIAEIQYRFITDTSIPIAMAGLLMAIPGTDLHQRLQREGRMLYDDIRDNVASGDLNFRLKNHDPDRLREDYTRMMRKLYSPEEFYRRCLGMLDEMREAKPVAGAHLTIDHLKALGKAVMELGVRDPDRQYFWDYLGQVMARHRERLPKAVAEAIKGYHFREVIEERFGPAPAKPAMEQLAGAGTMLARRAALMLENAIFYLAGRTQNYG
jgi:radical SAM superfamily enzyme YgiQ (UPF0313 family)